MDRRSHRKQQDLWNNLRQLHAERRDAIQRRLREFSNLPASEYFYELAYCLMTPQTSAENADKGFATLCVPPA